MARNYINDKQRIELLIAQARRQRGDIDTSCLSETQRGWFEQRQQKQREYASSFSEPEAYYAATIEADYSDPIPLREDISEALFGKTPKFLVTASADDAAQIYWRYAN